MSGTSSAMAWLTAVPIEPDELSTCSSAGDTSSRNEIAPSAASTGSFFATLLISVTACLTRVIAGCDFQPNAWRRKRVLNSHLCASALGVDRFALIVHPTLDRTRRAERGTACARA